MISKELASKIRYIQIYTNKAVNDIIAGEYHSVFKGRGMEFDEVREYQPGDDVRAIDWNVTARIGHPFVKQYVEERELTVFFLVDLSASGDFGSAGKTKNEVAAELCGLLAFSAIKNNDKVGLIVFTDTVELFIPPKKGVSHVLRLIRELLGFRPRRTGTDLAAALEYFGRVARKRCVAFLVSDFIAQNYEKPLRVLARRHDMITFQISDPAEFEMPPVGLVELQDAETGEMVLLDAGNPAVRQSYREAGQARARQIADTMRAMAIDHMPLVTTDSYVQDLVRFFRVRERKRR